MLPPASAAQPPQTHQGLVLGERTALEDSHGLPLQVNRAPVFVFLFHKAQTAFDSDGERAYTGAVGVSAFSRACGFSHENNHTADNKNIPRVLIVYRAPLCAHDLAFLAKCGLVKRYFLISFLQKP